MGLVDSDEFRAFLRIIGVDIDNIIPMLLENLGLPTSTGIPINFVDREVPEHTLSWYLSEIIAPNNDYNTSQVFNDRIKFTYKRTVKPVTQKINMLEYITSPSQEDCPGFYFPKAHVYSYYEREVYPIYVSNIHCLSSNTKVNLAYDNLRPDLPNAERLKGIDVTVDGELVKSYSMKQKFFGQTIPPNIPLDEHKFYKRMFLAKLQNNMLIETCEQIDPNGDRPDNTSLMGTMNPYEFSYNNPDLLARKDSYQYDHWGFFNNANNNDLLFDQKGSSLPETIPEQNEGAHRFTNINTSQYGTLSEIAYPTASSAVYTYESNSYLDNNLSEVYGGGVRLSTMNHYSGINNEGLSKTFIYGDISSGILYKNDNYQFNVSQYIYGFSPKTGNPSSIPLIPLPPYTERYNCDPLSIVKSDNVHNYISINGPCVAYKEVTESFPGNGYIVQEFKTGPQDDISNYPFPPNTQFSHRRGLLESNKVYSETGNLIREDHYEYNITTVRKNWGVTIGTIESVLDEALLVPIFDIFGFGDQVPNAIETIENTFILDPYQRASYEFYSDRIELDEVESTIYEEGGSPMVQRTDYTYRNSYPHLLQSKSTTLLNGFETNSIEYEYTADDLVNYSVMNANHMHNYPISVIQSGKINKVEEYTYESKNIFGNSLWLLSSYHDKTTDYKKFYDNYDNYQNLIEYHREGDVHTHIAYDNSRHYLPIYETINPKLGCNDIQSCKLERNIYTEYDKRWSTPTIKATQITFDPSFSPYVAFTTGSYHLSNDVWLSSTYSYDNLGRVVGSKKEGELEVFNIYRQPTGNNCTEHYISTKNRRGITTRTYLDGLSRPIQKSVFGLTSDPLITPIRYTDDGKITNKYLPFSHNDYDGSLITDFVINSWKEDQAEFYDITLNETSTDSDITGPHDQLYTQVGYDNSPLNRVSNKNLPEDWEDVSYTYKTNEAGEVKKWSGLAPSGTYAAGGLFKESYTDERGLTHERFKNFIGQLVLYRKTDGANKVDTYYQYDGFGNLTYIIPPMAVANPFEASKYAFIYTYDTKQRLTSKKVPGKATEEFQYDALDRVTVHFNGLVEIFIKYDELSRPILTSRKPIYPSTTFLNDPAVLTETVYDYFSVGDLAPQELELQDKCVTDFAFKDKVIATRVRILKPENSETDYHDDMNDYIFTFYDYDEEGRNIVECSNSFLDESYKSKIFVYNPAGDIVNEINTVDYKGEELEVSKNYSYDNAGRILTIDIDADGAVTNVTTNTYDALGRLASKNVGGIHKNVYEYNLKNYVELINNIGAQACDNAIVTLTDSGGEQMTDTGEDGGERVDDCWESGKVSLLNIYILSEEYFSTTEEREHFAELVYYIYDEDNPIKNNNDVTLNFEQQNHLNELEQLLQDPNQPIILEEDLMSNAYQINEVLPLLQAMGQPNQQPSKVNRWSRDQQNELVGLFTEVEEQNLYENYHNAYYKLSTYVEAYCEALSEINGNSRPILTPPGQRTAGESIQDNNGIRFEPDGFGDYAPIFSMTVDYDTENSEIDEIHWRSALDCVERYYVFEYDWLGRLIDANYEDEVPDPTSTSNTNVPGNWHYIYGEDLYSVNDITYDLNGNIKTIKRNGFLPQTYTVGNNYNGSNPSYFGVVDDLNYEYDGNRLIKLDDSSDNSSNYISNNQPQRIDFSDNGYSAPEEYEYDENGNMTFDKNRKIKVKYNMLNLPEQISRGDHEMFIYYDANGNKLRKTSCITEREVNGPIIIEPIRPIRPFGGGPFFQNNPSLSTQGDPYGPFLTTISTTTGGIINYPTTTTTTTECYKKDYIYNREYVNDVLEAINHEDGRIVYDVEDPLTIPISYDFIVKDHLGNGRLFLSKPVQLEEGEGPHIVLQQEKHYYPFGLTMTAISPTFTTPGKTASISLNYSM